MGFWLALSGKYDLFHILLGVLSVALVLAVNASVQRTALSDGRLPEWQPIRIQRMLLYVPWLFWQMLLSSIQVARVVLHPRVLIDPCIVRFRVNYGNEAAKVILGNSITLTPGTLTLEISGDEFLVHALTRESPRSLVDGTMPREVAKLFQKSPSLSVTDVRIERAEP